MPTIKSPLGSYSWLEPWASLPPYEGSEGEGRTHGIVATRDGIIVLFRQSVPSVLLYTSEGVMLDAWGNMPGAHGMTLVDDGDCESLWLTDEFSGKVAQYRLDGQCVNELPRPGHVAYKHESYAPTWVAVDDPASGGSGDIWVADGYGAHLVHRYNAAGEYRDTLDGTSGAGRFSCPHGVAFMFKEGERLIYIADRGNKRFQVFKADRTFHCVFGQDCLSSPDTYVPCDGYTLVPELFGRLTILDSEDRLVGALGEQFGVDVSKAGWSNRLPCRHGFFNSPHACCVDAQGNIYVVEWRIGGRTIKLKRLTDD